MKPPVPQRRTQTIRQALRECLEQGPASSLDLSGMVGIPERDVESHLEHLRASLKREGLTLIIDPAVCMNCDFVFKDRKKLKRPGSCPNCRDGRVTRPLYSIG